MVKRQDSFAERFEILVREFGSRYRLAKASGVSESTLQQYSIQGSILPPRADILIKLAHAASVSVEWLATGKGEMRGKGMMPGATWADVVTVELLDTRAPLNAQRVIGFLPFSRSWLEHSLGVREPNKLMLIEASQSLPPEIRMSDLLIVERYLRKKVPTDEGIYMLEAGMGLVVRRIKAGLKKGFVVTGSGISEEMAPEDILRALVGRVIWRGGEP
jgi:transcriptional regulator with XRE-family HTH domain